MIRIAIASDNAYVQHCSAFINSVVHTNTNVEFFFLTEGITSENEKILRAIANHNGCSLEICLVPSDIVSQFPMSPNVSSHISIATYYRLFLTTLLPEEIDKILYLDCDMIVRGSLQSLWDTDLSEYPLAAVYQYFGGDNNDAWSRLRIDREKGYFNAGCLLMNLKMLRLLNFQDKALSFIEKNYEQIFFHDQDVLNALFSGQVLPLECKWNYLSLFYKNRLRDSDFPSFCHYCKELSDPDFSPVVVHFVSVPKPWHYGCDNPYKNEYFLNLKGTPWECYKVHFSMLTFLKIIYSRLLKLVK